MRQPRKTPLYDLTISDIVDDDKDKIIEHTNITESQIRQYISYHSNIPLNNKDSIQDIPTIVIGKCAIKITVCPFTDKPRLLEPTDTWSPHRKHNKELFEGYLRAKYGHMIEFIDMYNEGIDLLRGTGQPVYLKYIENFMRMMEKQHYPDHIHVEASLPRFYHVHIAKYEGSTLLQKSSIIVSFSKVITAWPKITGLIEAEDFDQIILRNIDRETITITKLTDDELKLDKVK